MLYTAHCMTAIRQEVRDKFAPGSTKTNGESVTHPYIPNSVPEVRERMLEAVGASSVEEFYADIPESIRLRRPLDLPSPMRSEAELVRHMDGLLARNIPGQLSFLGAGCYQHHVPAVVNEIANRSEFLTA